MGNFAQTLETVLVESEPVSANLAATAKTIVGALDAARLKVRELEQQLDIVHRRLSAELALTVRRLIPSLNVGLNKNGCKIGYKTKHLLFVPDVSRGVWNVKSSDPQFASTFFRHNSTRTVLSSELSQLAEAIALFFRNHYKSLGEDIIGTGVVMVDDERGTLSDLVIWRQKQLRPLNSRLGRLLN